MNTALYDVIIELGAKESTARAAANAVPDIQHLATKEDIAEVKVEIAELRSEVRTEIAGVKVEIAELRSEVQSEIAGVRVDIAQLRTEMHRGIWVVGFSIIGTFLTAIVVGVVVLNRLLA